MKKYFGIFLAKSLQGVALKNAKVETSDELKWKINGGGASVTVKANGNIRLAFR